MLSFFGRKTQDFNEILGEITPLIRSWGFKGSGQNYRKLTAEIVAVINFQKSSNGKRFYINLGVQPIILLSDDEKLSLKEIKEYECLFRTRIKPPKEMFGWPYKMSKKCLNELKQKFQLAYDINFAPLFKNLDFLTELTPKAFIQLDKHSIFDSPYACGCIKFARIALAKGNKEKAKSFILHGLDICSPEATKQLRILKDLSEDIEKTNS